MQIKTVRASNLKGTLVKNSGDYSHYRRKEAIDLLFEKNDKDLTPLTLAAYDVVEKVKNKKIWEEIPITLDLEQFVRSPFKRIDSDMAERRIVSFNNDLDPLIYGFLANQFANRYKKDADAQLVLIERGRYDKLKDARENKFNTFEATEIVDTILKIKDDTTQKDALKEKTELLSRLILEEMEYKIFVLREISLFKQNDFDGINKIREERGVPHITNFYDLEDELRNNSSINNFRANFQGREEVDREILENAKKDWSKIIKQRLNEYGISFLPEVFSSSEKKDIKKELSEEEQSIKFINGDSFLKDEKLNLKLSKRDKDIINLNKMEGSVNLLESVITFFKADNRSDTQEIVSMLKDNVAHIEEYIERARDEIKYRDAVEKSSSPFDKKTQRDSKNSFTLSL